MLKKVWKKVILFFPRAYTKCFANKIIKCNTLAIHVSSCTPNNMNFFTIKNNYL